MAGTSYQSDAAAMAKGVAGFEESAASVRATMTALENTLRDQLARYQGAQAQAFWQVHARVTQSMTLAGRELDTMSELVRTSATNYDTGDTDVESDLRSIDTTPSPILNRLSGN